MSSLEWYYVDAAGNQGGPCSQDVLKSLWDSSSLHENCMVWNENLDGWVSIHQAPELKSFLNPVAKAKPSLSGFDPSAVQLKSTPKQEQPRKKMMIPGMGDIGAVKLKKAQNRSPSSTAKKSVNRFGSVSRSRNEEPEVVEVKRERKAKPQGNPDEWQELFTTDGLPYYHNKKTNETTWDKPDCLKSSDELDKAGEWVWAPDSKEAFVPARVTARQASGKVEVETEDGRCFVVSKKVKLEPLQWSQLTRLTRDLVMLDVMNQPLILHNLKKRFAENEIYTNVGTILISVNPYKRLPLYTPAVIDEYRHRGVKQLPPHVFTIADDAYEALIEKGLGQSIVISGESGAGKTECTKQCLQYLAEVAGSETNVEQKILSANPILEAFGNAKTVRNNNSSRFGKYVEIFFDDRYSICGAKTLNYLLEKSRVVYQAGQERNYHVFYQLCLGADAGQVEAYGLSRPEDFNYLNQSGDVSISGVDDAEEFAEMQSAMRELSFSGEEVHSIFQVCAAILHLGNTAFTSTGDRKCAVSDEQPLTSAAALLQVTVEELRAGITTRIMRMRGAEDITIPLGVDEARAARDALSKFVYAKLFDWLVERINVSIGTGVASGGKQRIIGILDIFGFEIFESNSLEQLCINYTNEKLQQFFNEHTFKLEEAIYEQEKIKYDHVTYIDNQGVLNLIEKKPNGILPMIDEELRMPKGSDKTFVAKLISKHKDQLRTAEFDHVLASSDMFLVKHYAGNVAYDSAGFLVKNKDRLNEDTFKIIEVSQSGFLRTIFADESKDAKQRKQSLGSKFATQLNNLMTTLQRTEPHYIRCVKPNPNKAPMEFNGKMVLEQLTYSGVFEAVQIRKSGFPFRYTHSDFWKRYRCVLPKKKWANPKAACPDLIEAMGLTLDECQIGVTRVLYRAKQHRNLELRRNVAIEHTVIMIQANVRGWIARRLKKRLLALRPLLVKAIQTRTLPAIEKALEQCTGVSFEILEIAKAKRLRFVLVEEKRVNALLLDLVKQDPEEHYEEFCKAVASADDIELRSDVANKARELLSRVKDMRECRQNLAEGLEEVNEAKLQTALEKAAKLNLKETPDLVAAREMFDRIQQEKEVIGALEAATASGGFLSTGDVVDYSGLEEALSAAQAFGMKTEQGLRLQRLVEVLRDLRKAMESSLGTKVKHLWKVTEAVVLAATDEFGDHPEVAAAREEVSHQAAVDEIAAALDQAVNNLDQDGLSYNLQQAQNLNMSDELYPVVSIAAEYLERIVECRRLMADARKTMSTYKLVYAIEYADSFTFNTEEVQQLRSLRDTVLQINVEAAQQLDLLIEDRMKGILARAEAIKLNTPDIEQISQLLLETPEEKFVQLQLKAAVRHHDPGRVTATTIRLKDLFFKKSGPMFVYKNFPVLRSPQGWAGLKWMTMHRDELAASFYHWTKHPIHASLMELDSRRSKEAVRTFKNVMGFMGDRQYPDDMSLAQELVTKAVDDPELRDEIYCQLVKQLCGNPGTDSKNRGWQLMAICLNSFPPREFENYLEYFLRENAPQRDRFVGILHSTVYAAQGGQEARCPTEAEMRSVINGADLRQLDLSGGKSYDVPVAELHSSDYYRCDMAPQPPQAGLPSISESKQGDYGYQNPRPPTKLAELPRSFSGPRLSLSTSQPPRLPQPPRPAGPPRGASANLAPKPQPPASRPPRPAMPPKPSTLPPKPSIPSQAPPVTSMAPPVDNLSRRRLSEAPPPPKPVAPQPPPNLWQVAYAANGAPYYWNTQTNEVTWTKPVGL